MGVKYFVPDCIKSVQRVYQNRTGFNKKWSKILIIKLVAFSTNFANRIERDPTQNLTYHDKELSENRYTDTLEKQTFFSSQYTKLVTQYGGWRYSFYRSKSHF